MKFILICFLYVCTIGTLLSQENGKIEEPILKSKSINKAEYDLQDFSLKKDCVLIPILKDGSEIINSFFGYKFGQSFVKKIILRHYRFYDSSKNPKDDLVFINESFYSFKDSNQISLFENQSVVAIPSKLSKQAHEDIRLLSPDNNLDSLEVYAEGRECIVCLGVEGGISDEFKVGMKDNAIGISDYLYSFGAKRYRFFYIDRIFSKDIQLLESKIGKSQQTVKSFFNQGFCKLIKVSAYLEPLSLIDKGADYKYFFKIYKNKKESISAVIDSMREPISFKRIPKKTDDDYRIKENPIKKGNYIIIGVERYSNIDCLNREVKDNVTSEFTIYQIIKDEEMILDDI